MKLPTEEEINSERFKELMEKYTSGDPGLNEADSYTESYKYRHQVVNKELGVWRWRGLYQNRDLLLSLLKEGGEIVDIGGGAMSLGFGAKVVDKDSEWPSANSINGIFTSHTLEHLLDAETIWERLDEILIPGGWFIIHVPAYTAPHWHAGTVRKNDAIHGPHYFNFSLKEDIEKSPPPTIGLPVGMVNWETSYCDYVGDNSILWVGRKLK
ncbi:MAG: hypothetical protein JJT78_13180 [Leptospira sp.]|nr:hypothetical protein [Leptospira sp.]